MILRFDEFAVKQLSWVSVTAVDFFSIIVRPYGSIVKNSISGSGGCSTSKLNENFKGFLDFQGYRLQDFR